MRALLPLAFLIACNGSSPDEEPDGSGPDATNPLVDLEDPAPGLTAPGSYSCDGCPDSSMPFDPIPTGASTAWTFPGQVTGAVGDGEFYLVNADGSRAIGGTIATDEATGSFSFTAPLFCGTQLLKCVWSNETGEYVLVTEVVADECVEPDLKATLTWDDLGQDWELHLVKEGGRINDPATDCTWNTCIGIRPDWGTPGDPTDDPAKDVDNTGNFGPENIFLALAEPGTYTVMVEHWGSGDPSSDGSAILYAGDNGAVVPIDDLAPQHVSTVATIQWPEGIITPLDERYDCTGEWTGGCQAAIP